MKLSSCDVTSYNDLWREVLLQQGGIRGGGWVHSKGADSIAISGLHFGNTLVSFEWATAVLLCMNGLRKQSSCPAQPPFLLGSKPLSQSGPAAAGGVL